MAIGERDEQFTQNADPVIRNPFDIHNLVNRIMELEKRLERYERQYTDKNSLHKAATGTTFKLQDENGNTLLELSTTTQKVSSADGKTYFDLKNQKIVMNDGSNDRLLLGKQTGGF